MQELLMKLTKINIGKGKQSMANSFLQRESESPLIFRGCHFLLKFSTAIQILNLQNDEMDEKSDNNHINNFRNFDGSIREHEEDWQCKSKLVYLLFFVQNSAAKTWHQGAKDKIAKYTVVIICNSGNWKQLKTQEIVG